MRVVTLALVAVVCLLVGSPVQARRQDAKAKVADKTVAVVNLNTATLEQLETLPGIGQKTAQLILDYREKVGEFKKIEELMNVKGIGEKAFLRLKPLIAVAPRASKGGGY
jgi:competence protein ComEA